MNVLRCRLAAALAVLAVSVSGGGARADEPAEPEAAVAAKVVRAFEQGSAADLATLAGAERADPWIVVDEILALGKPAALAPYAKHVRAEDVQALRRFVARRPALAPKRRASFRRAGVHLSKGEIEAARAALVGEPGPSGAILEARIALLLGEIEKQARRWSAGRTACTDAHRRAQALGWVRGRILALQDRQGLDQEAGNWLGVRDAAREVLAIHEAHGHAIRSVIARTNLANAEAQLTDTERARDLLEEALVSARKFGMPDLTAFVRTSLAIVQLKQGAYADALEHVEWAEGAFRSADDLNGATWARSTQVAVLVDLGDYERGCALADALLEQQAKASVERADTQTNRGICLASLERYQAAVEAFTEARTIYTTVGDARRAALVAINRGEFVHQRRAEASEALKAFERAAQLASQDPLIRTLARLKTGEAKMELARRAPGKEGAATWRSALTAFREALVRGRDLADRNIEFQALVGVAEAGAALGEHAAALKAAREAHALLFRMTEGLSDDRLTLARADTSRARLIPVGVELARAAAQPAELVHFIESGRAAALLESLGGRAHVQGIGLPPDLVRTQAETRARLTSAHAEYRVVRAGGDDGARRPAAKHIRDAEVALEEVERRIRRRAKRVARVTHPVPDDLARLRRALAPNQALLHYVLLSKASLAVAITRKGVTLHDLPGEATIHERLDAFDPADMDRDPKDLERQRAALLADLLPPGVVPAGVNRLFVCPDGRLAHLPWPWLLQGHKGLLVSVVPSGSTWRLLNEDGARRGQGVIALGDPVYSQEVGGVRVRVFAGGRELDPLPSSGVEVRKIIRKGDVPLLREKATKAKLLHALEAPGRRASVHLACHGLLHARSAGLASLALTPTDDDDGFLKALDVLGLRIDTDLVVLSACDVGRGKLARGEGLLGMVRAFMAAGAPRVLASLQPAGDDATAFLMTRFYEELRKPDVPVAEALRRAQQKVAAEPKWDHPFYWASWVLWGLTD